MLESANFSQKLPKEGYKARLTACQHRLHALQQQCIQRAIPVILVFEGWEAAGQEAVIAGVTGQLESHSYQRYDIQPPRTYETHLPWLWRFWLKLPRYGDIAIFHRSWYTQIAQDRVAQGSTKSNWRKACRDVVNFERALTHDGYVIGKFFLHISKKQQKRRFKKLRQDPLQAWRVQDEQWAAHRKYAQHALAIDEMLKRTHTDWAPWVVVAAHQRRSAKIAVLDALIARLEAAVAAAEEVPPC